MPQDTNADPENVVEDYEQLIGAVGAHLKSGETQRWLFLSVNDDDIPFSCSFPGVEGSDGVIQSESEMIAEYILTVADREGADPESMMRNVVEEMNNGAIGFDDD